MCERKVGVSYSRGKMQGRRHGERRQKLQRTEGSAVGE